MHLKERMRAQIAYYASPYKRETIHLAKMLKGKIGLEIGGPSPSFGASSFFPAYAYAQRIDGVNFSSNTVWEGEIKQGKTYAYLPGKENGLQYIDEAAEISTVADNTYDFLLSCHSLEHVANPLKALKRWREVLKKDGVCCILLPDKEFTSDRNRPYTLFDHLLEDEAKGVGEDDQTHFEEVIQLHELSMDVLNSVEALRTRTLDNFHNRCVHHHVFSKELICKVLEYSGFEVILVKHIQPIHLFALARKRG